MREILCLLLISCGAVLANECCPNGGLIIAKGYCAGGSNLSRVNITCEAGMALIENVYVKNGAIYESNAPNYAFSTNPDEYCIGTMLRNQSLPLLGNMSVGIVCFDSPENSQQVSGVLTLVSVVFLVITLGVYLYIPQLRDVEGLCYVSLCISMCLGFLALGTLQLDPGYENELCHFIGFMIYLWIMATFFWMNVISIHVYRTINDSAYLKKTPRKQFIIYSAYAWGSSVFMTLVTVISNYTEHNHLKPGIGSNNCWFQGRTETWAYFYGPVAVVIASNVILFMLSSLKLWRQTMKYEVSKLNRLKFNFLLSLKLFLVMGISWIFEIASFAHGQSHVIWQIMDTFNCLQGIVIFLILVVFRRRAILGLAGDGCCMPLTGRWAAKLSPHEDSEDQNMIDEDHTEVRLN